MTQNASSDSSGSLPISAVEVPRLLIIEDNDELRRATSAYFSEHGWHVTATRSYGAALALCDSHRPHVIISELMLPDVRGYRFVDALRRAAGTDRVRVIAVTRLPELVFARAKQIGFDEVLAKPVDLAALRALAEQR